jgi:cytochrome c oxidase accessory protein FixG
MNVAHTPGKPAPAPLYAARKHVYTKDVYGPVRSAKSAIMVACLAIYYTLPWLRWNRGPDVPDQAILLDLWHERFYFFNVVLWPQDIYLLTFALIFAAIALFLVTSLFGRVWCGYACPQTVWTDLFMTVERWIEGDRNTRMKRDAGPWTRDKIWRKAAKHWIWIWIAFWTGGAWIMYYVNAPVIVGEFWTLRASPDVYAMTALFTATTYLLAGWAREQVCTYMCPWPRFQSAMLDEQSLTVSYDAVRGEPRGHRRQGSAGNIGDCVDCFACVHVCPTGIDIRDGNQLECINCGLCVDACNHVMDKMGTPPWLIGWDTLAGQKARAANRPYTWRLIRPRTLIYTAALLLSAGAVITGLATRSTTNFSAIHDRAPLFVRLKDGGIRNGYTLKLANKTQLGADYSLTIPESSRFGLELPELSPSFAPSVQLHVAASTVGTFRLVVQGLATDASGQEPLRLHLQNSQTGEHADYTALFLSPAQGQ